MESQYRYIGFVGCYTKEGQADPFEGSHGGVPHNRSKIGTGVLAIGVDDSGKLSFLNEGKPIVKADELQNPSYLCILERNESGSSSSRPASLRDGGLCIVSELDNGTFQSFAVSRDGMNINAKSVGEALDTGGSYPCHIIDANVGDMGCIIVCNYGEDEGVLSMFGTGPNDTYLKQVGISFGTGSKVDLSRQQTSHAHSASITPPLFPSSMMDLCCADLGSDAIVQYSLSTTNSGPGGDQLSLQCVEKARLAAPPGSGPRSLMFNPVFKDIAIVSLEMTAQVWLIRRNKEGSLEGAGDPVSVMPADWPDESAKEMMKFNKGRWASDAIWSPDGKFVYAATRLHNSISVFQLKSNTDGGLELVERISTEGLTPRCLCMSECGKFILVAHQHSHDISSFQRNESNGSLSFTAKLEVPNAACVKLVRPDKIG